MDGALGGGLQQGYRIPDLKPVWHEVLAQPAHP